MPTLRQSVQVTNKQPAISADGYEPITLSAITSRSQASAPTT
jgi:hypothetical protein